MLNKSKVIGIVCALALFGNSCGPTPPPRPPPSSQTNANSNEEAPSLSVRLGKDEAITKVTAFLDRREGTVTVQLPYERFETVSRPCSATDFETDPNKGDEFMARCKPIGGSGPAAPYGSKTVSESRTECCKPKTVQWTTLQPRWTAEYSKSTDSWSVNMEFDVDAVKRVKNWLVNDKTGEVTETPDN